MRAVFLIRRDSVSFSKCLFSLDLKYSFWPPRKEYNINGRMLFHVVFPELFFFFFWEGGGDASVSVSCDNSLNIGDLLSSAPKICSLYCTEFDSYNFGFHSAFQKYFRRIVRSQLLFLTLDRPTN